MTNYTPALPARAHQTEGLARARGREGFGWLMEMGTGKTKTDLDETGVLWADDGDITACLILAPKGVYTNWPEEEIPKHWRPDMLEDVLIGTWQGGGTRRQQDMLRLMLGRDHRLRVMCMNIEAVGASDRAVQFLQMFLDAHPRCKVSIDESTGIKNPQAVRTRVLDRLRPQVHVARILSGQPSPNGPMDLYSQFNWAVPDSLGRSFYSYRARYAVTQRQFFGQRQVEVIVDYRNLEELAQRIAPHSFRKRKDECLDLPPKIYLEPRKVELTPEQARAYREMRDNCTTMLDSQDHVTATMALTQLTRLHQILCGHVTDEEGRVHLLPTRRPDAMLEHAEEVGESLTIWATYRPDIARIEEALRRAWGPECVVSYHGGVSAEDREIAKRRFNDGSARFFVSNQTGARGITLVRSHDALFYSNSFDWDYRSQAEDRNHRDGQLWPCSYQDLIVPGTMEELQVKALRRKLDLSSLVLRDGYRVWLV